jgi:glycosyltransferase involved in cell wall biosynthesis
VDTDRFHPRVAPALPAPDLCTIGFVGSLKPWHGVEVLFDAFARVHATHPRTRLLIVGDGPERASIERRAASLGIAQHTQFTGAVDAALIPSMITSMDIATAPYPQTDGCYFSPLKLFEYMACARAVAASRTGQVPDIIRDNVTGVLCQPGDAASLATALASLVDSLATRARLGTAAQREVLASRTWLHVGRTIVGMGTRAGVPQGAS